MSTTKRGVAFRGYLDKDPEYYAATPTSQQRLNFGLVEVEWDRDKDGNVKVDPETRRWVQKDSVYHSCVIFGPLADKVRDSLKSGSNVLANGDLEFSTFTDNEGKRRSGHSVVVRSIGVDLGATSGTVEVVRPKAAPDARPAEAPSTARAQRPKAGVSS